MDFTRHIIQKWEKNTEGLMGQSGTLVAQMNSHYLGVWAKILRIKVHQKRSTLPHLALHKYIHTVFNYQPLLRPE